MSHIRSVTVRAALGLLLAGALSGLPALAQSAFTTLDRAPAARVNFSATTPGGAIEAGSTVQVAGQGFRPGQQVSLLHGATPLAGGQFTADGEGKISGRIEVPADAVYGTHPLLVVAGQPYSASIANLKVSPTVPLSGAADYPVTAAPLAKGLYQAGYSAKNKAIFVTSVQGFPPRPIERAELLKLDPATLRITARAAAAMAPTPPAPAGQPPRAARPYAGFGLALDDGHDTVWLTATMQDTVSVYRQSDLSLVKQFADGIAPHSRDIAVDATQGKAYVAAVGSPEVTVFDTAKLEVSGKISIQALGRGRSFSTIGLALDATTHRLYVTSLSTNEVAVIDTHTDQVQHVFAVPGANGAISVSADPESGRIFVVSQGSDNVVVLDGTTGAVVADTPTGANPLTVHYDPASKRAYVGNRVSGTIAVVDRDGRLVANLGDAPFVNQIVAGPDGSTLALTNAANAGSGVDDRILRIQPKR